VTFPTPNTDESHATAEYPFLGNFHKTLPHNEFGEVLPEAYRKFERTCLEIEAGAPINYEEVPRGPLAPAFDGGADTRFTGSVARFVSPLAGASTETHGPDPKTLEMPPAPGILSASTKAEMVELYWMALLRDVPFADFDSHADVDDAVDEVRKFYKAALEDDASEGAVALGRDLPRKSGNLDLRKATLFRSGLHDEEHGPLVSQFFLRDVPYGTQTIDQSQIPYLPQLDFLTTHEDWLRDYGRCNFYGDEEAGRQNYYGKKKRKISTMRDLARFVNRDALHQAYFNAALFLDAVGAPIDPGNPYAGERYKREGGFATLGGPDLLSLVSEVASRALKVVWRQKWQVHRRARPEVYGGLVQMQFEGWGGQKRPYGLDKDIATSKAAKEVKKRHKSYFLPMAFSAGSPCHPAYGAGHATVAGACVTVLKAWFDEEAKLVDILAAANVKADRKEDGGDHHILTPGKRLGPAAADTYEEPQPYTAGDAKLMTVGGELNKIASNVAMGRSMGGVHWRTDNTRSLRLGEQIAIEILRKRTAEYAERPVSFTFRAFDGHHVQISRGEVRSF
jgi:hypothetical protein